MRNTKLMWVRASLGSVAFGVSHLVIAAKWSTWFQGAAERRAYWMNSASGWPILFTVGVVAAAGAIAAWLGSWNGERIHATLATTVTAGTFVAVGATLAMVTILFSGPGGGNLFPIAIAVGGFVLLLGAVFGSVIAVVSVDPRRR